jgi:hypothetical protein
MKLFDVAFSLVWVAVATAHGGIYTYNIPAGYVKGKHTISLPPSPLTDIYRTR